MCRWRAPEVGSWMEFLDLDEDGQPDSQTTGNVNGGRVFTSTMQNHSLKWWMFHI